MIAALTTEGVRADPIVTEVAPFDVFYPAKPEHQEYFRRNGNQPYCQIVINPKVAKLRQKLAHKLDPQAEEPKLRNRG